MHLCYVYDPALVAFSDNQVTPTLDERPDMILSIMAMTSVGLCYGLLEERSENPEVAQFFAGYGVREGGLPVERDFQFWIDVLEREGVLAKGQLTATDLLLVTNDQPVIN